MSVVILFECLLVDSIGMYIGTYYIYLTCANFYSN
jgi:hypothetical protein